jgi:hypothetical protein
MRYTRESRYQDILFYWVPTYAGTTETQLIGGSLEV